MSKSNTTPATLIADLREGLDEGVPSLVERSLDRLIFWGAGTNELRGISDAIALGVTADDLVRAHAVIPFDSCWGLAMTNWLMDHLAEAE